MGAKKSLSHNLSIMAVVLCLMAISAVWVAGQSTSDVKSSAKPATSAGGVPDDWSYHHLVFSNPGTFTDAVKNGNVAGWNRINSDPRFKMQQLKRNVLQRQLQSAPDFAARMALVNQAAATASVNANKHKRPVPTQTTRDWSMNMGLVGGAAATRTGTVSAAATDGQTIVITNPTTTSLTLTASAGTPASASGSFSSRAASGSSLVIKNGSNTLTLNRSTSSTTATCSSGGTSWTVNFYEGSSNTNAATGLLAVLASGTQCSTNIGVTASGTSPNLKLTANTGGTAGNSITVQWSGTSNFTPAWTTATNLTGGVDGTQSGLNFATSSTASTEAANIVSAINVSGNGSSVGVTATQGSGANNNQVIVTASSFGAAGNNITITNGLTGFAIGSPLAGGAGTPATMGAGQYPAKYSFGTTTGSCSDYVVYGTGVPSSSSQATVIAYTNLYKGTTCGSTIPTINWAYNTGGTAALSPVLSVNGTQVAYIQTVSNVASLVVLKMANSGGTASSPATINTAAPSGYSACAAPCYTTISLGANDTNSAPFYDYLNDVVYVGDDSGNLHQFTHVFNETASNYLTSAWSTNVSSADGTKYGSSGALSAPVLDPITGLIFVGDRYGYLHSVASSGSGLLTSGQLGNVTAGGPGINDGPLVDVEGSTSNVYVFVQNTNSSKFTYINEFATGTALTTSSFGTATGFAGVNGTQLLYDGAFDNQWYTSGGTSGNLYVCGVDTTNNANPTLFQVPLPLTNGTTGKANSFATLANAAAGCSPPTEFYNGTTDYLFVSVTGSGTAAHCTGACMYSFILPANMTTHLGTASAGLSMAGGSSGIVIDNSGSQTGESQIYSSTLGSQSCAGNGTTGGGTGGCAIQASQSGLN